MKTLQRLVVCLLILLATSNAIAQSKEAEKLYQLGVQQADKRYFDDAISNLSKAIKLFPQYKAAYSLRGFCFFEKSEYEISRQDYERVLQIDPTDVTANYYLGRTLFYREDFNKAISFFRKVLHSDFERDAYWWIASVYRDYNINYDSAIHYFNQMIRIDPSDMHAFYQRARCYLAKKDYDKAINDLNHVIKKENWSWPFRTRSEIYWIQGKQVEAIDDLSRAIVIDPTRFDDYIARGWKYRFMGNFAAADQDYLKAKSLEPGNFEAYRSLGTSYWSQKKYEEAIGVFEEAIRNTNDNSAYLFKARIRKQQGEYQKSDSEYTHYFEKINKASNHEHIPVLVRLERWELAKTYALNYLHNNPEFIAYDGDNLEECFLRIVSEDIPQNQWAKAIQKIDKTFADNAKLVADKTNKWEIYIDLLVLKGRLLEKLNKFDQAKDVYDQALAIHALQPDVISSITALPRRSEIANDKALPEIYLISPEPSRGLQIVGGGSQLQLVGKAKDVSGIAFVTINGKRIDKIEEDGLFTTTLSFKPGANNILITATDKKGNKATKTFLVTGNAVAKKQTEEDIIVPVSTNGGTPQYHAIIIAAKDYTDSRIQDLENPVKDAAEFKTILETNYTFNPDNIETLYNKSREEIMQSIIQKSNALGENDNLVIFYAGHGIAEKDRFGDVDGYWIPSSAIKGNTATYISTDDIRKSLKRSMSKHILVIADACFSGAFTRELSSDAEVGIQKQYNVPSRKIMASGNLEPVPDNSRFIYYLKKSLKENKQKYLTAKKLFDGFYEAILNNSDTSPQYAAIKNVGDEGGEFVFIKK